MLIDEIPLDVADWPITEMDDKSFGGIKPFGKRAVVLFHRDEIGWLSPPVQDVRPGEPDCEVWQVTRPERYKPESVQGLIVHHGTTPSRLGGTVPGTVRHGRSVSGKVNRLF